MAHIDERRLRERLARVEALERGATTPGERTAAAAARRRLTDRIARERARDPVARFVAAHISALGVPAPTVDAIFHSDEVLPSEREILAVLAAWDRGELCREDVEDWAERAVDANVLPTDPEHPQACVAEVLLQLAMLHRVAIDVRDHAAIRQFLEARDWRTWFAVLEAAARRPRPVG